MDSDSNLDVIAHSDILENSEIVEKIICKHEEPFVDSHHDVILSSFSLPVFKVAAKQDFLIEAPRVPNKRVKVIWKEDCIPSYHENVERELSLLRSNWLSPLSKSSISSIFELTNIILSQAAKQTNYVVDLSAPRRSKKSVKVPEIINSRKDLTSLHNKIKLIKDTEELEAHKLILKDKKREHRQLVRHLKHKDDIKRDEALSNSTNLFNYIKSARASSDTLVPFITVNQNKYVGDRVPDGLFESISNLKKQNTLQLQSTPFYNEWMEDYLYILEI